MARLSPKDKDTAKGFLVDLFYHGGFIQSGDTSIGNNLTNRWSGLQGYTAKKHAATICNEIKFRAFDFFNVDTALTELSNCKFFADSTAFGRVRGARMIKRSAETLASYIADFCKDNQIYWDDVHTNKSVYEIDQYKKTIFGAALFDFGCMLSQNLDMGSATAAQATAGASNPKTKASSQRAPGQPPVNPYKSSGPQSGNIRDLHGQPGMKVKASASGNMIFYIEGDNSKASASKARAMIKPLTKGAEVNGTNKVFINSSHGYTDCTCYFDDPIKADDFLKKCQAICPAHVSNLKVVKRTAERNGYFLVGTEFGEVAISAKTMNEKIGIDYEVQDPEAYEEAMFKYE